VSDRREQLVRDVYSRWNSGERELFPEDIHEDAVVYSAMTGDTFRGFDDIRRWMAEIDEQFDEWRLTIDEIRSISGERLLVLGEVHFRGRASGAEFDQPMGWLVDFDGDLITALHNIAGHDAAIEAAGLATNS
jgi:ketosteroid isomerase-like protein